MILRSGYTETANATLGGILIGVGLEYAFAPHWSTRFEYDYLGFQNQDVLFTRAGGNLTPSPSNTTSRRSARTRTSSSSA